MEASYVRASGIEGFCFALAGWQAHTAQAEPPLRNLWHTHAHRKDTYATHGRESLAGPSSTPLACIQCGPSVDHPHAPPSRQGLHLHIRGVGGRAPCLRNADAPCHRLLRRSLPSVAFCSVVHPATPASCEPPLQARPRPTVAPQRGSVAGWPVCMLVRPNGPTVLIRALKDPGMWPAGSPRAQQNQSGDRAPGGLNVRAGFFFRGIRGGRLAAARISRHSLPQGSSKIWGTRGCGIGALGGVWNQKPAPHWMDASTGAPLQ